MRFVQLTYHRCARRVMDNRLACKELTVPMAPVEEIAALLRKHLHPRLDTRGNPFLRKYPAMPLGNFGNPSGFSFMPGMAIGSGRGGLTGPPSVDCWALHGPNQ